MTHSTVMTEYNETTAERLGNQRRMQDAGTGTNVEDIPFRLINCLVSGLAYYLSMKSPEAAQRMPQLKQMYDEQLMLALDEDREKAPLRIAPRQLFY